jgi:hypothetical protein
MISNLSFLASDCSFDGFFEIMEKGNLQELASLVFNAWQMASSNSHSLGRPLVVKATVCRRDDGRSNAAVYQLVFAAKDGREIEPASFVIKIYAGADNGARAAARELSIAQLLSSTQSHYFASAVVQLSSAKWPNVVVYHHVRDLFAGEVPANLEARVNSLMEDPSSAPEVAASIGEFLSGVTHVFENRFENTPTPTPGRAYFERLSSRLVPAVVVDFLSAHPSTNGPIVLAWNKSGPFPGSPIESASSDIVSHPTRWIDESRPKWVQLIATPLYTSEIATTGRILMATEGNKFWLFAPSGIDQEMMNLFPLGALVHLVFNTGAIRHGQALLANAGFDLQAQMSWDDVQDAMSGAPLDVCWRHSDLHTGNILCGTSKIVAIDLAGVAEDLKAVASARLETSIWYRCAPRFQITDKEATTILVALESPIGQTEIAEC